ncbi:MAG: serine protease [Acidobacteria bacterium]|nr:serine protease [Acidobacteriota bacterium]
MAAIRSISNELSEDLARLAEVCGQCVVTLQAKDAHAVSGVAWQQKLVVTVNHAVRAEQVTVLFGEGKSAVARLKGRDPSTDLAILLWKQMRQLTRRAAMPDNCASGILCWPWLGLGAET